MDRRRLLEFGVRAAALAAGACAFPVRAQAPGVRSGAGAGPGVAPRPTPAGTTLVLLGTQGGPGLNLARGEAASVVIVDGRPYLVDCGYGTLRALVMAGVRLVDIGHVCVTHLHNDHTADVAALLSHQWTGSKNQPTVVHGPFGTEAMVAGAIAFFKGDTEVRTVDEGRTVKPEAIFQGHDVAATATPVEVLKDDRVRITAIENDHYPERAKARMAHRSLAFRVDTPARSIVFSGDTAPSERLVALARDADFFVCEAMDVAQHTRLAEQARQALAAGNENSVARHVAETHSTTEDVGRMAAAAKVKTVVLSHLLPGSSATPSTDLPDSAYIDAVRRYFDGQVIVGRDGMRL